MITRCFASLLRQFAQINSNEGLAVSQLAASKVHIRKIVKYEDYKRFGANVKILYESEVLPKDQQKPPAQPPAQNPPQK